MAFVQRFGHLVDTVSSIALMGFGGWIAVLSLLEMRGGVGHGHSHGHGHAHSHPAVNSVTIHGPELQVIPTGHGELRLSVFEAGLPPRFRLTGAHGDAVVITTKRDDVQQSFAMKNCAQYWESTEPIPEPHQFSVVVTTEHGGHSRSYKAQFAEHEHDHGGHTHGEHDHRRKTSSRTALLLILGSSPMVEGIPAFFAAGKYGAGLIAIMSLVFGASTIATYMVLCVFSTAGLQRVSLGPLERYSEVLSGAFIALVGVVFSAGPIL